MGWAARAWWGGYGWGAISAKASVIRFRGSRGGFTALHPYLPHHDPGYHFLKTHGPMLESRGRGGREAETPAINLTSEPRRPSRPALTARPSREHGPDLQQLRE